MPIEPVLDFAHTLVTTALRPGDAAVDATVGNGHDTKELAQAVGGAGTVIGFDVQDEALVQTRDRLSAAGLLDRASLTQAGHERMEAHVPARLHGDVGAVTFNLGYLPGSDSPLTTTPETTLPALDAALRLLRPGGVVTVVLYTGHDGGPEEARAVENWAAALPRGRANALSYRFLNQQNDPPRLIALEKYSSGSE